MCVCARVCAFEMCGMMMTSHGPDSGVSGQCVHTMHTPIRCRGSAASGMSRVESSVDPAALLPPCLAGWLAVGLLAACLSQPPWQELLTAWGCTGSAGDSSRHTVCVSLCHCIILGPDVRACACACACPCACVLVHALHLAAERETTLVCFECVCVCGRRFAVLACGNRQGLCRLCRSDRFQQQPVS